MSQSALQPLRIVGVHGVRNLDRHQPAETVSISSGQTWARHLATGLGVAESLFDVDFAYYAPLLHTGPIEQGPGDEDELDDPLAQQMMASWLEALQAPQPISQGALTLPLRYGASWAAEKFSLDGQITKLFIRAFFREVATYLRDDDNPARQAARETVAARIAAHRPRVVIAHSLGSIVAYETLHHHPELTVELLITLGSPLALPHAVFDRLQPRPDGDELHRAGIRPKNVTRWINIADPGDLVAIPPQLSRAFKGIVIDHTDTVHAFRFHDATNYLSCAATAATLAPYLGI
ncbi:serine peptidase [Streptacidiphilus sp. N1-3]|uniref:Serine peptidase n=1 Tax=Streptacidiphilus alkalitolerans TaxID=3342712 RepID=A0ABV6XDL8_9ACTN